MKVHSSLMGVGGWYECLAAGWLADMRSKQVPTSTTSARRLAALIRPLAGGGSESKPSEEEEERGGSPLGPGGPFNCSQCRGAYPTREQLDRHETLHSPSTQVDTVKYTCKICHKSFANVYRLQRHMISHDESAGLRKFKCNDCDKAFKFKHHLKEHLRIHSGEKPFECANCGKKFSHSGSYSSHMTSKKCLVMNLKMGRIKPNNPALNPERSPSRKRANPMVASQLNNNIPPNGSTFLPILPKYNEAAAAFFASMSPQENSYHRPPLGQSGISPFYMPPGIPISPANGIAPYSLPATISQLFEQWASTQYSQRKIENATSPKQTSPRMADPEDLIEEVTEEDDKRSECSAELVMDIEDDETVTIKKEQEEQESDLRSPSRNYDSVPINNNGLKTDNNHSGFNTLLERESLPNVAKQIFSGKMVSPMSENLIYSNRKSPHVLIKEEPEDHFRCSKCNAVFNNQIEYDEHEKSLCGNLFRKHESLAAQVAETVALTRIEAEMRVCASVQSGVSASEDEDCKDDREDKLSPHDSDRKIRVRTALSEEQQTILKEHYALNARPNREEFKRIAQQIGLDNRVVQVWFQNNRARVRRMTQTAPASDQPLDLSTKKSNPSVTSSPSPSPCSISVTHSDSEEAVNLSQKSSRSTTPHRTSYPHTYPHSNCSSSSLTDFRMSPSPGENINLQKRLLPQKVNPLVPMEKLLQYNDMANGRSPVLNMHMSLDITRQGSPSYERPQWSDETQAPNDLDDEATVLKKSKLKHGPEIKEGEGQFVCDQCDKTFVKQSSLARHKYEHSGQRPYKCMECPKAFKHKHHLTEHKRLHTGEKPFQCCKCFKKFSHSGSYSQHMNHRFAICKPYRD